MSRNRSAPRVRVQSPDDGSVVMSEASLKSSSMSSSLQDEPMKTPIDFGNLANENKTFPQRDEVASQSSRQSSMSSISVHKRHRIDPDQPRAGFRTLDDEKRDLLLKLKRLKDQKVEISRDYSMHSNIHDMRNEYDVLQKNAQVEASIRFQRKILIALTSGMEFLNTKYDPFNVDLGGWSETIMDSITDYDSIFERLHEKYKGSATMPPEFELLMAVAGSAFTFHLSNTFFKKSMGDAMKNPTAMKNIMSEIKKATTPAPAPHPGVPPPPPMSTPVQFPGMAGPSMSGPTPVPFMPPPQRNFSMEPRPQHSGVQILDEKQQTDSELSVSSVESEASVASSTLRNVPVPVSKPGRGGRGRGRGAAPGRGRGGGRGKKPVNEILL